MKTHFKMLAILGLLLALVLGLGANSALAQGGSQPTAPLTGIRIPINADVTALISPDGVLYYLDKSGNVILPTFNRMAASQSNSKLAIPLPQVYRKPSPGQASPNTTTPTGKHSLNIPWALFKPGDVLLFRSLNTDVGRFTSQYSYWSHSAFFWNQLNTLDSQPIGGVMTRTNTIWSGAEALNVERYLQDPTLGPTAMTQANKRYNSLPWNYNYANKLTTKAFYNSQFIWRAFFDKGLDLDSNYTHIQNWDVVSPDDIYYSNKLTSVWDSRLNMTCPDPQWKGQYYSNTTLSGTPYVLCDSAVDFDWGLGSPSPSLPSDNFSVRWTRFTNFAAGTYRFHVRIDDGVRLWIDNKLVIGHWTGGLARDYQADVPLTGAFHRIRMEYFDQAWLASAKLWWEQLH